MYRNLVLYRNELKNKIVSKYKLIGISSELVLSFEIFKKNSEISPFLKNVYGIEFKDYVFKSRTLIVAKISRFLFDTPEGDLMEIKNKLMNFIEGEINSLLQK